MLRASTARVLLTGILVGCCVYERYELDFLPVAAAPTTGQAVVLTLLIVGVPVVAAALIIRVAGDGVRGSGLAVRWVVWSGVFVIGWQVLIVVWSPVARVGVGLVLRLAVGW